VVHPGSGHKCRDTLIELATAYLLDKKGIAPGDEVALVHRLDRDNLGRHPDREKQRTLRMLHESFLQRAVEKEYRAVCHRRPPNTRGPSASISPGRTNATTA